MFTITRAGRRRFDRVMVSTAMAAVALTCSSVYATTAAAQSGCATEALREHNAKRASHNTPALALNQTLTNVAQDWANTVAHNGQLSHKPNNQYGENLFGSPATTVTCTDAVDAWYAEIKNYDYNNPGYSGATGHFTQVVWKNTQRIGVGLARGANSWTYVVVEYDPPGNYQGQFPTNVLRPLG
ncbi:CAP family protein [Nocardia sp. NPDC006044]|uniref:CAP family protein n=1 Tax=Nocardia sp. NPDC006044 TaxID=3364306 RepID=UPI0036A9BCED